MNIVDLEERFNRQLQRPRVTDIAEARMAATAWSSAVWSLAESVGPSILTANEIEHAFAVANRPVFIVGVHRSGTTLVRDLLDHHPALSVLPAEGTMLTNFEWHLKRLKPDDWLRFLGCEWLRRLANPINQHPYWLLGRSSGDGSPYIDFGRALMAWWPLIRTRLGQRIASWPLVAIALAYTHCTAGFRPESLLQRWVEKTPTNERFLARLLTEFPEAKLIHVVRDPLAVYASHRRRTTQNSDRPLNNEIRILHQMRLSYRVAATRSRRQSSGSYLLLRYEDLLDDTAGSIRRLTSFLGVQALPCLALPTANGIPTPSNSSFDSHAVAGRLNLRPSGDASGVLTQRDRERLSAMVGNSAGNIGYGPMPLSTVHRKLLWVRMQIEWLSDRLGARWMRTFPSWSSGREP